MQEPDQPGNIEAIDSLVQLSLLVLVLTTFFGNGLWVTLDTRPAHWDSAAHLRITLK
ncbi:MAG: hypothetical protein VYC17_00490 [Nitrospinota bacterium]|nr:hypothetical protein [Nitrospinota bacterium]